MITAILKVYLLAVFSLAESRGQLYSNCKDRMQFDAINRGIVIVQSLGSLI